MDFNLWELKTKEKICCFDIDGVLLSDYPKCWIDFVNKKLNTNFDDLNVMKNTISYEQYRKLKNDYRTSGVKEFFAANVEASEVTRTLKGLGYTILIMTARPADKYTSLYSQTINWLKNNKIIYDSIYFGAKDKHAKILCEVPHLSLFVEDNSYVANQIAHWGYRVFLLTNKYNKDILLEKNVIRINKLSEILEYTK